MVVQPFICCRWAVPPIRSYIAAHRDALRPLMTMATTVWSAVTTAQMRANRFLLSGMRDYVLTSDLVSRP